MTYSNRHTQSGNEGYDYGDKQQTASKHGTASTHRQHGRQQDPGADLTDSLCFAESNRHTYADTQGQHRGRRTFTKPSSKNAATATATQAQERRHKASKQAETTNVQAD